MNCHDLYNWPEPRLRRVVVGVDGSENSIEAARTAWRIAHRDGALLEAVFVYQALSAGDYFVAVKVLSDALKRALGEPLPRPVQRTVLVGRPADVLTHLAADADLLVVGASGYAGALRALLGSTALRCVREAKCPVLVVPQAEREPAKSDHDRSVVLAY